MNGLLGHIKVILFRKNGIRLTLTTEHMHVIFLMTVPCV